MKISKYTKLGILIVFSLTVLVWGLSYLKGNDIFKQNSYYHVYYDRISGLAESNKVTLSGFQIGHVHDIKFAPDQSGRLIVTLAVDASFRFPVNTTAHIVSSDIMGTRSIEILLGKGDEFYQPNDTIPGTVESDLKEQVSMQVLPLKSKAEELLATIDSAITVFTVIFNEEAQENLSASFTNINQTIKNLEQTTSDLQDILATEKDNVKQIVSNIEEVTEVFKNNASAFEETIQNLNAFSDSLSTVSITPVLTNISDASDQILTLLEKLNSDESTAGLLLNDDELYNSLNGLSENLAFLVSDIQRNPKRYLQFSAFDFGKEVYVNTKDDVSAKNILFKIHLVSTKTRIDTGSDFFEGLDDVEEYYANGIYSYLWGSTGVYTEIEELYKTARLKFPESTIVAFKNGRLIKIEKALKSVR